MSSWQVIEGDCRAVLAGLPAASVHTCTTSPPYFGLRDYGHDGQIGLEPTPDEFAAVLVGVFREVRRVLRDDATVWLNLGDSYAAHGSGAAGKELAYIAAAGERQARQAPLGTKPKDLLGIPWLVAFALRADGWYLRSEIIWHKPNPMPESVTDRPTKAHEQVFLLSKSPRYFYDADAIREAQSPESLADHLRRQPSDRSNGAAPDRGPGDQGLRQNGVMTSGQRNRRSVWTVATQPYAGAHFATFPPKLIEPCILAGCPERCCVECGAPWQRIVERTTIRDRAASGSTAPKLAARREQGLVSKGDRTGLSGSNSHNASTPQCPDVRTLGFEPSCGCNATAAAGTVLDPFAGAGTTGMVALRHGRSFVGIELNADYAALARQRIRDDAPLFNAAAEAIT